MCRAGREVELPRADEALARLRQGSIVWGWECHDNESLHVGHASRRGLRVLCSTNCPNLSFHSLEHKVPMRCLLPVEQLPKGLSLCSVWEAGRLSHNTGAAVVALVALAVQALGSDAA